MQNYFTHVDVLISVYKYILGQLAFILLGVYFTVSLSEDKTFLSSENIKFDRIIINVGGGFIDDNSNAGYGKFITPRNGTYQFSASICSETKIIAADLEKNGGFILATRNGDSGTASLSAILDLEKGDEVYLKIPYWIPRGTSLRVYFTGFSGVLVHANFWKTYIWTYR